MAVNRREFLGGGVLGSASLALAGHAGETNAATHRRGEMRCICLFLSGGMSSLDLWDPKPEAPAEIRSEFSPVDTAVPGMRISSLLPRVACITDKLAIVRSVTHGETEHPRAMSLMTPSPWIRASGPPSAGEFVREPHHAGRNAHEFPSEEHPRIAERIVRAAVPVDAPAILDAEASRSNSIVEAVGREPEAARRQYGNTDLGRSCLWARQQTEAGCPLIGIRSGHWDTHRNNSWCLKELLAPPFDKAFASLIEDLDRRGLLDSTLVVVTTEFGRSPRINPQAGRDHWPGAFSVLFAGGGVRPGQTVGATDRLGAAVTSRPVTPFDLDATIQRLLYGSAGSGPENGPRSAGAGRLAGELVA
jgi:hypothetical protein